MCMEAYVWETVTQLASTPKKMIAYASHVTQLAHSVMAQIMMNASIATTDSSEWVTMCAILNAIPRIHTS